MKKWFFVWWLFSWKFNFWTHPGVVDAGKISSAPGTSVHFLLLNARKKSFCLLNMAFNMRINRCRIISQSDSTVMGLCRNLGAMRSLWHFTHVLYGFRSAKWHTCYLVNSQSRRLQKTYCYIPEGANNVCPYPAANNIKELLLICKEPQHYH